MNNVKVNYGLDAPKVLKICFLTVLALISSIFLIVYFLHPIFPILAWFILVLLIIALCGVFYPMIMIIIGSYVLKFRERDWLLDLLHIKGDERVLDVGCGRGLLLIAIAKQLKIGKVIGIDIWCSDDQTSNSAYATLENARLEGVLDNIEVITADARHMPFDAASFDIVVSSWALHNIAGKNERQKALYEIMRVLKPGGTVAIMDIESWQEYEIFFKHNNFNTIELFGPRYTFGNPTYLVKAKKIIN